LNNPENMMDNSVALDKEDWLQIIEDLLEVGPILQRCITETVQKFPQIMNRVAAMDPETFELDIRAACAAMAYVAEFAADKCRFIQVKEE